MSENKHVCDKLTVGESGPILFEYDGRYTFKILRNDVWTRLLMKRGYLYDKFNVIADYNYLEKGSVVVDVGGNVGTVAIPLARAVGPSGKVLVFEPQTVIRDILIENMKINHCKRQMIIYDYAVGHQTASEGFTLGKDYIEPDSGARVAVDYTSETPFTSGGVGIGIGGENIKMTTIDALQLKRLDLLKVDVEGAEPLVFYGAQNTIKQLKPVILFEKNKVSLPSDVKHAYSIPSDVSSFNIAQFCADNGYSTIVELPKGNYMLIPAGRQPTIYKDPKFKLKSVKHVSDAELDKVKLSRKYEFVKPSWEEDKAQSSVSESPLLVAGSSSLPSTK